MHELNYVHIESSTACNATCRFCPHSQIRRRGTMDYDLFTSIVDQAMDQGCVAFTIFRLGEPLIFTHLFKWLDYLKEKKAKVSIYTNGSNLTPEIANRLKEYHDIYCDFMISFHGYDRDSYEKNMGLNFAQTYQRILEFMVDNPIKVNIYSLADDIYDTSVDEKFRALWDGVGFAGMGLCRYMEWAGNVDGLNTIRTEMDAGKVKAEMVPCPRILHEIDVMYDGTVCLCCVDAHGEITFGNLNDLSLEEVLKHKLRAYYQSEHLAGRSENLPLCKNCSTKFEITEVVRDNG